MFARSNNGRACRFSDEMQIYPFVISYCRRRSETFGLQAYALRPIRPRGKLKLSKKKGVTNMITAIVQFHLPKPLTRDKAQELFLSSAPKYRQVHGLMRKYYLLSEDGATSGGVYLFKSREDAERLYSDEWKKYIVDKYGGEPSIAYFESPIVVDNVAGEIIKGK
jgi:hypothetical protein